MNFLKEESGQGAAEYILLFGGVIVMAIASIYLYFKYVEGTLDLKITEDISTVRTNAKIG